MAAYIVGQAIIFLSCGFFFFLSMHLLFSSHKLELISPSQIECLSYFDTWCGLSANLGRRSAACCTWLAGNAGPKNHQKFAICAPSHNFVGPYLCNKGTYWQSKKLVKQQYLPHMSLQYGKLRPTSGWDRFVSLGATQLISTGFASWQFDWRPLLQCRAVTLPRRETRWNYLGCPKLTKRSQPLVGRSSPYCRDMWSMYWCITIIFFRLSIRALVAKI